LRRVRSTPHVAATRGRGMPQLCLYDAEANRLLVSLKGAPSLAIRPAESPEGQLLPARAGASSAPIAGEGMLSDELSEDELDQILEERRANIDRAFQEPVEGPTSFIKVPPFAASASERANQKLARMHGAEEVVAEVRSPTPVGRASAAPGPASTFFSLTGLGEEAADLIRGAAARPKASTMSAMAADMAPRPASPGQVRLPPIDPSSRSSSACSTGRPAPPVPNVGVREAMRALRAAALSEYAVAA